MYVLVDLGDGDAELAEPGDTKRLHLAVAHGDDPAKVAEVLAARNVGRFVDDDIDHVWVDLGWIRAEAAGRVGTRWTEDLDKMVEKAAHHGWVDGERRHVRAHVEWISEEK